MHVTTTHRGICQKEAMNMSLLCAGVCSCNCVLGALREVNTRERAHTQCLSYL